VTVKNTIFTDSHNFSPASSNLTKIRLLKTHQICVNYQKYDTATEKRHLEHIGVSENEISHSQRLHGHSNLINNKL